MDQSTYREPREAFPGPGRFIQAALMLCAICFLALVTFTLWSESSLLIDSSYYATMALATGICAARVVASPIERTAWLLMAIGLLCDLVADVIWTYLSEPLPWAADAFWIVAYFFLVAALIALGRERLGRTGKVLWLDGVIATLTLSAVGAALIYPAIVSSLPDDSLASVATLAYPLADTVVLAVIFVILAVSGWQLNRSWLAIIVATVVWVVADMIYSYQEAVGSYTPGAPVDLAWPFAVLFLALSAWVRTPRPQRNLEAGSRAGSLAAFCGLIALAIVVAGDLTTLSESSFILATAALAGVGVRLILAQRENRKLLVRAETDPLTGVGSRGKLNADADHLELERQPVTVAIFDLDGFKFYNDNFGHPAGDRLLQRLAHRMNAAVGDRGRVYRIGGDEFLVLLWGRTTDCQSLFKLIGESISERGEGFELSASRGSAEYPDECPTIGLAVSLADERMYSAKSSSRTSARSQVHQALVRSIRERQPDLAEHTNRVSELSVAVARKFVEDPEGLDVIERAAQLHDVGKVAIPDAILDKPGPLDDDERALMMQHTIIGERIIAASPAMSPVALLVRHSHEHWDGSGYPDGLKGAEIPLGSRIILACDALEAMTGRRPYGSPRTEPEAIDELRSCAGRQFDSEVVDVLIEVLANQPLAASKL